jgi:hypothetical protein
LFIAHDVKGGQLRILCHCHQGAHTLLQGTPDKAKELEEDGIDVLDLEATWDGVFKFRHSLHEFAEANASIIVSPDSPLI